VIENDEEEKALFEPGNLPLDFVMYVGRASEASELFEHPSNTRRGNHTAYSNRMLYDSIASRSDALFV